MSIKQLDEALNKVLVEFSENVRAIYPEDSKKPVTEGDICELGRNTFYALDAFRKEIIGYLKSQN